MESGVKMSTDPLERIDRSYRDLILQHLNGTDILQAAEVSPNWHHVIGESEEAMKKIFLNIIDCEEASEDGIIATVLESPREYQNLFAFSQNKREVIMSQAESLVEIIIKSYDVKIEGLNLPNLKKLELDADAIKDGLMSCANNLEELGINSVKYAAIESLNSCLRKNEKLKRLRLGASPCIIFKEDLSFAFNFQLTHLQVKLFFLPDSSNFFKFLCSQAASLQHLTIHNIDCDSSIFNVTINNLVNLTTLKVYCGIDSRNVKRFEFHDLPKDLFLYPNKSIKAILVQRLKLNDLTSLNDLLVSVPNLESLEVLESTVEAFDFTISTANKLKEFRTAELLFQIFDNREEFKQETC